MRRLVWLLAACLPLLAAEPYKSAPGPLAVATVDYDWTDAVRGRRVPVRLYYPEKAPGPLPIVVFSHGLGGTREGYALHGKHWASHGYVCVHVQHLGSDDAVWRGALQGGGADVLQAMKQAAADPRNAVNRPKDISFALDKTLELNETASPLKGRLDAKRVGMAGHSFGAYTTQAIAGQVFVLPGGREASLGDERFRAAIAMSPAPYGRARNLDQAFGAVKIPVLHLTGTLDTSPINDTRPEERRVPYDHIKAPHQCLVIFNGGDHMVFSGARTRAGGAPGRPRIGAGRGGQEAPAGMAGDAAKDPRFHDLLRQVTTAFWDAWLRDDAQAKAWLGTEFAKLMGADGTFEAK